MSKHNGGCATQRRWWQRYPMFGLAAGWAFIATVMMAGMSEIR